MSTITSIKEDDKGIYTVITRMTEMTGVAGMTRITKINCNGDFGD